MKEFLIAVGIPFVGFAFLYVLVWFGGNVFGRDRNSAGQYDVESYREEWDHKKDV
ncbi:MAG: hypothetical protein NUV54_00535 [Candidatus Taylorbacteria bacterium]|nr:hypothetical protein [Candidatus Taylorbacteria bacterium]